MKRSLKNIIGYTVETTDGEKGKIKDFLFDEEKWIIRYIDVDFGNFFKDKRILLPINVLIDLLWDSKHFLLNITKEDIEKSPTPEDKLTISREYEKELMKHYGFSAYWSSGDMAQGLYYPIRPINIPSKVVKDENLSEEKMDSKLRSFNEVKEYHILATDGNLGHVEDMIADDDDWQMIYLVVDTSNWRPWSKKLILLINWLEKISYETREVSINLHSDIIKNAPEYDTHKSIEQAFEEELLEYYEKKFVE